VRHFWDTLYTLRYHGDHLKKTWWPQNAFKVCRTILIFGFFETVNSSILYIFGLSKPRSSIKANEKNGPLSCRGGFKDAARRGLFLELGDRRCGECCGVGEESSRT
jgi:hypothetical protein